MGELYELPYGWEWTEINKLASSVHSGFACSKKFEVPKGYIHLRTHNISTNGKINLKQIINIPEAKIETNKSKVIKGDILFNNTNSVELVGKTALIEEDANYAYSNHITKIQVNDSIEAPYLVYYLQLLHIQKYFERICKRWIGQAGVNNTLLKRILIPRAPLPEQQRIVSKLDLLFEKIDRSIALHQKNMDEADLFMGSVLNDVFGELEEKYSKKKLKDIVDNYDGKRVPIKSADRDSMQGKYPYYGASGIIDYINGYIFDGEYLLISEDGANLTARKYPIAFIAKGKFWVNNHAHIVKAKENLSTNKFMEYAFSYTDIRAYITGSAQPKMSQGKMNLIEFSIPPLQIQQKVVNYLDEISEKIEKIKSVQKEKMDSLKALKASILDKAFKGEL